MPSRTIPLVGPTSKSRTGPVSDQVTKGFYIQIDRESSEAVSLVQFPGAKYLDSAGGLNRGMGVYKNVGYVVNGSGLYSFDSAGTLTLLGNIGGSGQCHLEASTNDLVITTGEGKPYVWDGATLTQGTDADLPDANRVTYINNRVVYDSGGNSTDVYFADLGSPLNQNSLNVTSERVRPDNTKAVIAFNQQVYVYGERSIAPYYNDAGAGNPPYRLVQNGTQADIGLGSVASLTCDESGIYWQAQNGTVYAMNGYQPQAISNGNVQQEMSKYPDRFEARGSLFKIDDQIFYYLTFPSSGSWLWSRNAGWLSLGHDQDQPSIINKIIFVYDKLFATDRRNGNLYELDFNTFTNNGAPIFRERTTTRLTSRSLGAPGRSIFINSMTLHSDVGVGLITGTTDPQVMMDWRKDGQGPWSSERWKSLGELGDYTVALQWDDMPHFEAHQGLEFRFRVTDPIRFSPFALTIDFDVGDL